MHGIYVHPKTTSKKAKKEGGIKNKKKRKERMGQEANTHAVRRPSPEGTRLLVAGTISPMKGPVDDQTEGRHEKTGRKTRREEARDTRAEK